MLNLEVLGSILGRFGSDFGSILAHGSDSENSEKPFVFFVFFVLWGVWGGLLRRLGHCLDPC